MAAVSPIQLEPFDASLMNDRDSDDIEGGGPLEQTVEDHIIIATTTDTKQKISPRQPLRDKIKPVVLQIVADYLNQDPTAKIEAFERHFNLMRIIWWFVLGSMLVAGSAGLFYGIYVWTSTGSGAPYRMMAMMVNGVLSLLLLCLLYWQVSVRLRYYYHDKLDSDNGIFTRRQFARAMRERPDIARYWHEMHGQAYVFFMGFCWKHEQIHIDQGLIDDRIEKYRCVSTNIPNNLPAVEERLDKYLMNYGQSSRSPPFTGTLGSLEAEVDAALCALFPVLFEEYANQDFDEPFAVTLARIRTIKFELPRLVQIFLGSSSAASHQSNSKSSNSTNNTSTVNNMLDV